MKKIIVILHGWRLTGSRYEAIQKIFEKKGFIVYSPDLPGFGSEEVTQETKNLQSYVDFVQKFFIEHKITKAILIGHSFGGRVAATFTAKNPKFVEKLVLTGSPLIKQSLSPRKKFIVNSAKVVKVVLQTLHINYKKMRKAIYLLLGEWDYYKANHMKEIFLNIIAENIAPNLPFIRVPTVVIWGEYDAFVPKKIGKQIAKQIANATYIEISEATHKLPYEMPELFAREVLKFIM